MLSVFLALAVQTAADAHDARSATAQEHEAPLEGIWFTRRTIDGMIGRWVDQAAEKYGLNEDQSKKLEEQMQTRWPKFLRENRRAIQPLLNEYIETRVARTPPDADSIKAWAERAQPVFDRFEIQTLDTLKDMRSLLTFTQKAQLAVDTLKTAAGLELFKAKLGTWRRGEFKERDWWDPTRSVRRQREHVEPVQEIEQPAPSPGSRRIGEELLRWDYFVAEFIVRFNLDEAQRETAHSVLRECKSRAAAHRDQFRARIERLEKSVEAEDSGTDARRAELTAMYGPIDAIFAELKTRIEAIPTTAQTATADHE